MKSIASLLVLVLTFTFVASADACNCRGRFRRPCSRSCTYYSYRAPAYYPPKAVAYQQPSQTIVINNAYNGTAALTSPLSGYQGQNTVYGYSQAAAAYTLNPSEYLNQAARLVSNAQNLGDKSFSQYSSVAAVQLQGQTEVARILANAELLKAANVGAHAATVQSLTVKTVNGKTSVTTNQPTENLESNVPAAFTNSCVKCHSGATPKGKLSLDQESFDCKTITKSLRMIADAKMPPPDSGVDLSQAEKGEIMRYFLDHETPEPSQLPAAELPPPPPEQP